MTEPCGQPSTPASVDPGAVSGGAVDVGAIRARAEAVARVTPPGWSQVENVLRLMRTDVPALLAEVERLRAEVAARLNADDYDPAPIILEYDRMVAERDAYRAVVDAARAIVAAWREDGDVDGGPEVLGLISAVDALPRVGADLAMVVRQAEEGDGDG